MPETPRLDGRAGNILKNSTTGLINNVLPSLLRFFTRYVFIMYFGDTLLGVNSLFADVVTIFSFAEIGIYSAISFYLYKPIAEKDTERIQAFLGLYRKLNRYIMLAVTVIGLGLIPFLQFIKTQEPIPGLLIYYLIFLAQNILSYMYAYRTTYLAASQKAYQLAHINVLIAFATEITQILVTILTRNFIAYLITYTLMMTIRILWSNHYIVQHYPDTNFKHYQKLDRETIWQFVRKMFSMLLLKVSELGVSQTDSMIVSTMVDVTQWGYVSNYMAIKKMTSLVLSSLAGGLVPSLGILSVVESRERQEESFRLYNFCNTLLCINLFAGLVILVPPFIELVFGTKRVLDDLTCFLLFFNVLYAGLLEPVAVLRDAMGQYERDKWINVSAFFCNLITSILFVQLLGLPGVFLGTLCSTTITYYRIYNVLHHAYNSDCKIYYGIALKTVVLGLVIYGILHFGIFPLIWNAQRNLAGLVLLGIATVVVANSIFFLVNRKDPYLHSAILLFKRFLPGRKA